MGDDAGAERDQIVGLVGRYAAAVTSADAAAVAELFAADAVLEDPVGARVVHGREAIESWYRAGLARLVDPLVELAGPVCVSGGEAAFVLRSHRRATGQVLDIIDVIGVDDDGRIRSLRAWWSPANLRDVRADGT